MCPQPPLNSIINPCLTAPAVGAYITGFVSTLIGFFLMEELNLLQTIADAAALALENAQLFTQVKEEKERVEMLLENRK